jgi:hypothetical protein
VAFYVIATDIFQRNGLVNMIPVIIKWLIFSIIFFKKCRPDPDTNPRVPDPKKVRDPCKSGSTTLTNRKTLEEFDSLKPRH